VPSYRGHHVNVESYLVSTLLNDVFAHGFTVTFDANAEDAVRIIIYDSQNMEYIWDNDENGMRGKELAEQLRDAISVVRSHQ